MKRIALIGSGVLARHMAHYLRKAGTYELTGYFDDFREKGSIIDGASVSGNIADVLPVFRNKGFDALFIGIGYKHMALRQEIFNRFTPEIPFETYIHPSCHTDASVVFGAGVFALPGCIFDKDVRVGNNVFFNIGCLMAHDAIVRDNCFFGSGVKLGGFASAGPDCFIGINTTLINNVDIASNISLGAGTVVTQNLSIPGLYVGAPARKIK